MGNTDPFDGRLRSVWCPWRNARVSYMTICGKKIV